MLKKYDHLDEYLDHEHIRARFEIPQRCLASHLMEELELNEEELHAAMQRTFDVCCLMDIEIRQHFRQVYISDASGTRTDWLMSDFGSYLLLINGQTTNPNVARAQVYFLKKQMSKNPKNHD
jgi:hypothetical protein